MTHCNVSVIIPAHNAADTLEKTIASLMAQTVPDWEAIIVDDGSQDDTGAIATQLATQDARIRAVSQVQGGVSAARNHGIRLAQYDWLLFLDADDWIAPNFLEQMTAPLSAEPGLGWVCCGWARVTPDGQLLPEAYTHSSDQVFTRLACTCTFAIHACVVRKALVVAVGGFYRSFHTCEDWDLWQRIARTGAPLKVLTDGLVYYRMRPGSASTNVEQMLNDAFRVIDQGHAPDARVVNPLPQYRNGQPIQQSAGAKLQWLAWAAGLVIGNGQDATVLLERVRQETDPGMSPYAVAYSLFCAAILPTCQPLSAWGKLWPDVYPNISKFLTQLETHSQTTGLARRSQLILEHLILDTVAPATALTLGFTYAQSIEVTEPIAPIDAPEGTDRLYAYIQLEGELLGAIELPICDGWVTSEVLADAIAAQFSWTILGRFFQHTVYSDIPVEEIAEFHSQTGWQVFLQQLWNHPDWPNDRFYDTNYWAPAPIQQSIDQAWLPLEISEELPDLTVTSPELTVSLTVGGVPFGSIQIPVVDNQVTAQALRVAFTLQGGLELCHAVVREALVGKQLTEPTPLWQRLAEQAEQFRAIVPPNSDLHLVPYLRQSSLAHALILGRYAGAIGTSVGRRAMLPVAAAQELQAGAIARHELVNIPEGTAPEWALYAPEWYTPESIQRQQQPQDQGCVQHRDIGVTHQNRNHFETLFATKPDPWKYTSDYEQTKYDQTLSLLPRNKVNNVLELACAEGHFTVQLAPHVKRLLAADISEIALDRTAERCKQFRNIDYKQIDLVKDALPGTFELIICSEVLYYVGDKSDLKQVAIKMVQALEPGGYLLMAHAHTVVDEPDRAGFDWMVPFGAKGISDTFSSLPELRLAKEIWTPLYRIQLFQRLPKFEFPWQRSAPELIKLAEQPTALLPHVAARVLWQGGAPQEYEAPPVTTEQLPILMYHRVAPTGSDRMTRYRVTPQAFEQQLKYLRDAGYYSVTWEAWREAKAARRPLPGRAIALTFDDGYQDVFDYAAPLLKQYGFSATVFLVADYVGRTNSWDAAYGEPLPLMDWSSIRQLQAEGIEFGSHTCSHAPLTSLTAAEIVHEAVRSRTLLEQNLGRPVQTLAYPYGDNDAVVRQLVGACGYLFGFSCESGRSTFRSDLLYLPRLEVSGTDTLADLIKQLTS